MAKKTVRDERLDDRIAFFALDLLDESKSFPGGFDVIWMSQFLDCFSEKEIVSILRRAARALPERGLVYILELFWDRQPNETAAFCLQQTSLYFSCIANGNSQMYQSVDMIPSIRQTDLHLLYAR